VVHVFNLIGFRNRLVVSIQWTWSYLTYQRGARLITGQMAPAPTPEPATMPDRLGSSH